MLVPLALRATVRAPRNRAREAYSRLEAVDPLDGVFRRALALMQCIRDMHDLHALLSPEQLDTIVTHVRVDGLVRGMRGEGILQLQLYYINQWLALAFQRLEMWDSVIQRVSWALERDKWTSGKKR